MFSPEDEEYDRMLVQLYQGQLSLEFNNIEEVERLVSKSVSMREQFGDCKR